VVAAHQHRSKPAQTYLTTALAQLDTASYTPNLNCLHYLAATTAQKLQQPAIAAAYLDQGISFVTEHNSHYMLANYYHLLAVTAQTTATSEHAKQYATMLTKLFHEKIYQPT